MSRRDTNQRLVYSTDQGRLCPRCSRPVAACRCTAKPGAPVPAGDGTVRVRRETKGRKGKGVTTVSGVPLTGAELTAFAKTLKKKCATGGSVKDGVIEIQGDHRATVVAVIEARGWPVTLAGG